MKRLLVAISLLFVVCVFTLEQTPKALASIQAPAISTPKKSVAGVALITRSLAAMLGSSPPPADSQATGTITFGGKSMRVLYKSHGAGQLRVEVDKTAGKSTLIVNEGQGQVKQPDGRVRNLLHNNTYGQRVEHIPALSLLAEYANSELEVEDPAEDDLNGSRVDVVTLSMAPASITSAKQAADYRKVSRTKFFLDKTSGYVLAIEYPNFAENAPGSASVMRTVYSDYRKVNGIAVPFQQTTFMDGQLFSSLALDAVSFDVTWLATEFELTTGVK